MRTIAETTYHRGFSIRFAHDRVESFDPLKVDADLTTEVVEDRGKAFLRKVRLKDDQEIERMKLPFNACVLKDGKWQPLWNN